MDPKAKGIIVGVVWFFIVGGLVSLSSLFMVFMHSGGVSAPGRVWATSLVVSVFATPPLLALAGLPLAYHIYHERPALKVGLMTVALSIAILVVSWVVPIVARGI